MYSLARAYVLTCTVICTRLHRTLVYSIQQDSHLHLVPTLVAETTDAFRNLAAFHPLIFPLNKRYCKRCC